MSDGEEENELIDNATATSIAFSRRVPEGDNFHRSVCDTCGFVDYVNPKIVVGSVVTHGDQFLLCRRAIEPRYGFWTLPAGFMEEGETSEQGAAREAMEEANAAIEIRDLLAIYNIPRISQVQLMYRAICRHRISPPGLKVWKLVFFPGMIFLGTRWLFPVCIGH